jgi:hypothetical protein
MSLSSHIDVLRLRQLGREPDPTDAREVQHLKECEECQMLLRVFTNQQRPQPNEHLKESA